MQYTELILSAALGLASSAIASLPPPSVQEAMTTPITTFYAQNGTGVFGLAGRSNTGVTFISIVMDAQDEVDMSVRLADGRLISFGGTLAQKDAYTLDIHLRSSGMADASGIVNVRYGVNQSILSLTANGQLDGQTFFMTFRGDSQQNSQQ